MSLLAFEINGPSPVSDLLTPAQRQKLASELNSALLISQSQEKDPKVIHCCFAGDTSTSNRILGGEEATNSISIC